ncbi:MAG: hypothetical protein WA973_00450 [Mesorhizobium sp.]
MRLIRLYLAIALLRTSRLLMEAGGRIVEAEALARGPLPKPVEPEQQPAGCSFAAQVLLGSIVGLAIAFLWVWISARAGR